MPPGAAQSRETSPQAAASAHEELAALRARAAELEKKLQQEGTPAKRAGHEAAKFAVAEKWTPSTQSAHATSTDHPDAVHLKLAPEEHDAKMGDLIGILQHRGVSAAIRAAETTGSPHLIDDFHRVLVEYVHEGFPAKGVPKKGPLHEALGMVLLQITIPRAAQDPKKPAPPDPVKVMRDFVLLMEQFYRGMQEVGKRSFYSFEIAKPVGAHTTQVYAAVPSTHRGLLEKQLQALYPTVRISECLDDYNAFAQGSQVAGARAKLARRPIFGLKTITELNNDPLDVLYNSFSKLDDATEGAAVQFAIWPYDRGMHHRFTYALDQVRAGFPIHKATWVHPGFWGFLHDQYLLFRYGTPQMTLGASGKRIDQDKRPAHDDGRLKAMERKTNSPLMYANIRIVASAPTNDRAQAISRDIEASFNQFADTAGGNELRFKDVSGRAVRSFARDFSYRLFKRSESIPLSAAELAAMAHPPRPESSVAAPELQQEKSGAAPAPADLPAAGTLLGVNRFRGEETRVYMDAPDRLRHLYLIGQTGTGKSTLLDNVVIQDIKAGAGVCFIDPHGTDVLEILAAIPPERYGDVIYFDPGNIDRPLALNMLEYDPAHPEQKTLVVDELLGIFKKLFGAVPESMGPAFEQYFRNSALLVMEDPETGNTLLDISRVFADPQFRALKLSRCKNPIIKQFWEGIAGQATGEQSIANYGPYITNKFDAFTTNEIMRPIIAQQKSSFNFRDLMDNRKILLVNLAKGRIGDINANLLGLIIVGKFLIAALSRADSVGKELPPFYLHIDEFQNFTTPSIATIFSEARKYKLSLTVAHQFIAQLDEKIRDAVFGNVGSIVSFRVGAQDAEFLEKQFAPQFAAADLMHVDNFHAFVKLLVRGRPALPFNLQTVPFEKGSAEVRDRLAELSALQYGRPRQEVEEEIARGMAR